MKSRSDRGVKMCGQRSFDVHVIIHMHYYSCGSLFQRACLLPNTRPRKMSTRKTSCFQCARILATKYGEFCLYKSMWSLVDSVVRERVITISKVPAQLTWTQQHWPDTTVKTCCSSTRASEISFHRCWKSDPCRSFTGCE